MPLIIQYGIKLTTFTIGSKRYDVALWYILFKTPIQMAQTKALRSKPLPHMDGLPTKRAPYLVCKFDLTATVKLDKSLGQPGVNTSIYRKKIAKNPLNGGYMQNPSVTGLLNLCKYICRIFKFVIC